jgi:hypothetical protein
MGATPFKPVGQRKREMAGRNPAKNVLVGVPSHAAASGELGAA